MTRSSVSPTRSPCSAFVTRLISIHSASARTSRQAGAAKDEPATVKAAERITETVLAAELPDDAKPAAGEAVHYGMGALSGAIYGAAAEIVAPVRIGNGLAFGAAVWWIADNTA